MKFVSPEEAVAVIKSGDRVFVHSVAASPQRLVNAMTARAAVQCAEYVVAQVNRQMRGASLSEGGKPIIALPSVTARGESRIVPYLKQGAGVVTTRAHVHYVATEYGVANLYGKNLRQRAR